MDEQSFRDYEWVVVDGGSDDGSVVFLKGTSAAWSSEEDFGIYDAMNKGIERAGGRYLLFLNAGDVLAGPDVLNRVYEIAQGGSDFLYGDSLERIGGKGERSVMHYKPARAPETLVRGLFTHHQAMFYARAALGDLRYDTAYKIAADYDLTARFLAGQNRGVRFCRFPICIFEGGGVSQTQARLGRAEQFAVRRDLGLVGPVQNRVIYWAQAFMWAFRQRFSNLYWRLKSSGNSVRAGAPAQSRAGHPENQP